MRPVDLARFLASIALAAAVEPPEILRR